jgi:hypothetical protein
VIESVIVKEPSNKPASFKQQPNNFLSRDSIIQHDNRFVVLTAGTMKITFLWDVKLLVWRTATKLHDFPSRKIVIFNITLPIYKIPIIATDDSAFIALIISSDM